MVVDDTRAALYTLARLLETMGQHVVDGRRCGHGLELIQSDRPDLVISDLAMPNMNGYELAQHVREDPAIAELVLVALTGYGQESNRRQAKEAGFDYYLVKPVSLECLKVACFPAGAAGRPRHGGGTARFGNALRSRSSGPNIDSDLPCER